MMDRWSGWRHRRRTEVVMRKALMRRWNRELEVVMPWRRARRSCGHHASSSSSTVGIGEVGDAGHGGLRTSRGVLRWHGTCTGREARGNQRRRCCATLRVRQSWWRRRSNEQMLVLLGSRSSSRKAIHHLVLQKQEVQLVVTQLTGISDPTSRRGTARHCCRCRALGGLSCPGCIGSITICWRLAPSCRSLGLRALLCSRLTLSGAYACWR
jgi:hypothetical protein